MNISGKVESKSRNGTGVKVNGQWYNGSPATLATVNWKDVVDLVVDGNNIIEVKAGSAPAQAAPQKAAGTKAKSGWDDPNRQKAIIYQSSRKDAIEIASAMLTAGVLPLPAKKEDKFDAFMAFVDFQTDRLYGEAIVVQETGDLPSREEGDA